MSAAILAVDVGTVRIGVACCAGLGLPALALTTLQHRSREKDIDAIVDLARERGAQTIVVGYPLRLDSRRGPAALKMDRFIAALRAAFDGDVVAVDERMTSALAARKLRETGASGAARRELVDRFAAVEILESYLARKAREA
ncbi:MAG: Holliday junction resolvase RuvX [Candidatus Eremiobacteraeota bacterium]|nr:Holliday junction resolvase RuvX [Candidatus Eremiobacteraeota bacterium]